MRSIRTARDGEQNPCICINPTACRAFRVYHLFDLTPKQPCKDSSIFHPLLTFNVPPGFPHHWAPPAFWALTVLNRISGFLEGIFTRMADRQVYSSLCLLPPNPLFFHATLLHRWPHCSSRYPSTESRATLILPSCSLPTHYPFSEPMSWLLSRPTASCTTHHLYHCRRFLPEAPGLGSWHPECPFQNQMSPSRSPAKSIIDSHSLTKRKFRLHSVILKTVFAPSLPTAPLPPHPQQTLPAPSTLDKDPHHHIWTDISPSARNGVLCRFCPELLV